MQPSPGVESYVKEIWLRRWRIVAATFVLSAVTAIVSLLLPKTYEATAQLMVLPSQEKLELAAETPAVQTCQLLLGSPKYLREVLRWLIEGRGVIDYITAGNKLTPAYIEGIRITAPVTVSARTTYSLEVANYVTQLNDEGLRGLADFKLDKLEDMSIEDLGDSLFADVTEEKKTAIDIIYSPIIQLRARGRTAEQAAALANVWAAVFLHTYGKLIRGNSERAHKFWKTAAGELEKQRGEKLKEIQQFRLRYNLEFLQGWIDQATKDYRVLQDDLARQQLELDSETSKIVSLVKILEAIEDKGSWIGGSTVTAAVAKPGVTEMYRDMRESVLSAARRMRRATGLLDSFIDQTDLETLRKEAERASLDLVDFQSRQKQAAVRADQTSRTLASIKAQLNLQQPTLSVRRDGAAGGSTEVVNPAWEELQIERIRLEVEYGEALAASEKLGGYIERLGENVRQQSARLRRLEIEHEQLRANLDLAREEYNGYQEAYAQLKRELYDSAQRLGPLRSKLSHMKQAVADLKTQIDEAMTSITLGQTGLAARETEDATWEEYVELSQKRLREAELAVQQQGLDVYVSAEAIPPTKKIWPQRTLMVLGMAFLGFFFSVGFVGVRHYLTSTELLSR